MSGYRGEFAKQSALHGKLFVVKDHDSYLGPYRVTPKAKGEQVLKTKDRVMKEDITVLEIPYYEVSNGSNGTTVFIAKEV